MDLSALPRLRQISTEQSLCIVSPGVGYDQASTTPANRRQVREHESFGTRSHWG